MCQCRSLNSNNNIYCKCSEKRNNDSASHEINQSPLNVYNTQLQSTFLRENWERENLLDVFMYLSLFLTHSCPYKKIEMKEMEIVNSSNLVTKWKLNETIMKINTFCTISFSIRTFCHIHTFSDTLKRIKSFSFYTFSLVISFLRILFFCSLSKGAEASSPQAAGAANVLNKEKMKHYFEQK